MTGSPESLDTMLQEDRWMRAIARQLAFEGESPDDLAQDAWVERLRRGSPQGEPRSWLFGLVRNLGRQRARSNRRRQDREQLAARPEELPDTAELVSELQLRRRVTELLLELEEPYRTTLSLHFYRDCSLREIGRRHGISVSTVHERLKHGLDRLRSRLDELHDGDRRTWVMGLLPIAQPSGAVLGPSDSIPREWTALASSETVLMGTGTKIVAAATLVGAAVLWAVQPDDVTVADPTVHAESTPVAAAEPVAPKRPLEPSSRAALAAESTEAATVTVPVVPTRALSGRVVDPSGVGLADVTLEVNRGEREQSETKTRPNGAFEFGDIGPGPARVACSDAAFTTLMARQASPSSDALLVLAPARDVVGVVVDVAGDPIAGADVHFRVRQSLFRELTVERPFARDPAEWSTTTDAEGRFELQRVATGTFMFVQASAPGFRESELDLPSESIAPVTLALERDDGIVVRGRVVDAAGLGVEDARVAAGQEITRSDAMGRFELLWRPDGTGMAVQDAAGVWRPEVVTEFISALKPGVGVARERLEDWDPTTQTELLLQLESPLSITGVVRDSAGAPQPGVFVWTGTRTRFGSESVSQGENASIYTRHVEDLLRGEDGQRGTTTDAKGRFELGGLLEREYELCFQHPRSLLRGAPRNAFGGDRNVELTLEQATVGRVAGRVLSTAGVALPAQIIPARSLRSDVPGEAQGLRTTADEDGYFELEGVVLDGLILQCFGDSFWMHNVAVASFDDPESIEIAIPLLCDVQVDASTTPGAYDRVRILDEDGKALELFESFGVYASFADWAKLADGRSGVLRVPQTARTILYEKDGEEMLRRPLDLEPGQLTVLHP